MLTKMRIHPTSKLIFRTNNYRLTFCHLWSLRPSPEINTTYWRSALLIVCVGTSSVYSSSKSQSGSSYEILLTFVGIELQSLSPRINTACWPVVQHYWFYVLGCVESQLASSYRIWTTFFGSNTSRYQWLCFDSFDSCFDSFDSIMIFVS